MAKKVLIAEDNQTNREMLSAFARALGYEVTAVNDGVDLLHLATEGTFDVIITDLMMAPLDGAAATEILKMLGDSTPVIALTALAPDEVSLVGERFSKVFHKPCNFEELFEYVNNVTNTGHENQP